MSARHPELCRIALDKGDIGHAVACHVRKEGLRAGREGGIARWRNEVRLSDRLHHTLERLDIAEAVLCTKRSRNGSVTVLLNEIEKPVPVYIGKGL